uniref:Uncharacterized protein n=1 Tax=Tanacetum cinerariifolium TaxID=118510 RepID=A0A6L2MM78_TANCI|nr:hypothetical protein [Tanacetum cinerariifolium]
MDKKAVAPTVTIKAKINVVKEICEALTATQVEIFEKICEELDEHPFRNKMFSRIEAKLSVKLNDVIDIFDKTCKGSLVLEDNDAVKICLLLWILKVITATHRHVRKQPTEKIPRALAWELTLPFTWSRCKHVQSKVVSEQLKFEKDDISETKRKRGSSQPSNQDLTYDQLMAIVTKMEGIIATLT